MKDGLYSWHCITASSSMQGSSSKCIIPLSILVYTRTAAASNGLSPQHNSSQTCLLTCDASCSVVCVSECEHVSMSLSLLRTTFYKGCTCCCCTWYSTATQSIDTYFEYISVESDILVHETRLFFLSFVVQGNHCNANSFSYLEWISERTNTQGGVKCIKLSHVFHRFICKLTRQSAQQSQ